MFIVSPQLTILLAPSTVFFQLKVKERTELTIEE